MLLILMKVKAAQSCLTLCDPMEWGSTQWTTQSIEFSRPEWVAVPFSRGSCHPRDQTQVSCIAGGFFTSCATGKPINLNIFKS